MAEYSKYSGRFLIDTDSTFIECLLDSRSTCHLFNNDSLYEQFRIPDYLLEKYKDDIWWEQVSYNYKFSNSYLIKFIDYIWWRIYLSNHFVDESILDLILDQDKFHGARETISFRQKISNKFISKHLDKLHIDSMKTNKHIDQIFIQKLELLK